MFEKYMRYSDSFIIWAINYRNVNRGDGSYLALYLNE